MKFAIVNDIKTEATPGAKGTCPSCGLELIAKCGKIKINHWAHKGTRNCDPWWENETEWHRSWKNQFLVEWQEVPLLDEQSGEKHIADIRTNDSLVIEFQNSPIDPQERTTREKFYRNMVWVVNGTRLKGDYPRFIKGNSNLLTTNTPKIFRIEYPDVCFPSAWLGCLVPVLFDFRGTEPRDIPDDVNKNLYCLFPTRVGRYAIIAEVSRTAFIDRTISGELLPRIHNFLIKLTKCDEKEKAQLAFENELYRSLKQLESNQAIDRLIRTRRY
jgi:competence protein CoiA